MAITNKEINLSQLSRELGGAGLIADFNNPQEKVILPADGVKLTEAKLQTAISAHTAIDDEQAHSTARQALLEKLGITADEAKLLLG
jgi:hypothetical protein